MIHEGELKRRLQEIANKDFEVPPRPERYPLLLAMGTYIGSPDPELRDDLIYTTLATWIWRDVFKPRELIEILQVVLNKQHLFWGLGDIESDTVFTRSFSMLIVASILNAHVRHPFLPDEELIVIQSKILRYINNEKDLRGYVPGKGWAHAVAHTADALEELVQCAALDKTALMEIMETIQRRITSATAVFICEEEERQVSAVIHIWRREEITEEIIFDWLKAFHTAVDRRESQPEGYRQFINVKNFLRSLYFRSLNIDLSASIEQCISETLAEFNRF
ncbi:MAG: DUF2785 domain-containing protein [Candidatus Promineifilaceae bacterium]|nr:DUF2785 domain-containing protein [Candidatus Promineifilaceae bacterium]